MGDVEVINPFSGTDSHSVRITENGIKEKSNTGFILAPVDVSKRTWKEYFKFRLTNSTIMRYWYHCDLEPDDANSVVTTAFIVNAVILTIPFGVLPVLNNEYWNYFFCQFQVCVGGNPTLFDECMNGDYLNNKNILDAALYGGFSIYTYTIKTINICTYCSIIGLLLGVLFFIFVPNDKVVFRIWWTRGRIILALIIISILSAIGGLLNLMRAVLPYALTSNIYGCIGYVYVNNNYGIWSLILSFTLFITLILSF
jgi:hypothetical protein